MTIFSVEDDQVCCSWFGKAEQLKSKVFLRQMLQPGSARAVMVLPPCPDCDRYAPLDVRLARERQKDQVN